MVLLNKTKSNFTAGMISPTLYGRADLKAYQNGAGHIENMVIAPTGGLNKRPGLRLIDDFAMGKSPEQGRLISFIFSTSQAYLLAFGDRFIDIYLNDKFYYRIEDSPYELAHLNRLDHAQSGDVMILSHPDLSPRQLVRYGIDDWRLEDWSFYKDKNKIYQPYFKFANSDATLTPSAISGTITLNANQDIFSSDHDTVRFRLEGKEVEITQVIDARKATATAIETLKSTAATTDWQEAVFSPARGYMRSICYHQDRLTIGGSRDLPNRVWMSKSADFQNFDLGEGLDDEAIELAIHADEINPIHALFSGKALQIFTSGGEWAISGDVLTPSDSAIARETHTGSQAIPHLSPCRIEGGTIFASRHHHLCEFLRTDLDESHQATDLQLLTKGLFSKPMAQAYDAPSRRLYVVNDDGNMAVMTLFRDESVLGWTKFTTNGKFLSITSLHDHIYVLIKRDNGITIERFDNELYLDEAITKHEDIMRFKGKTAHIFINDHYQGLAAIDENGMIDAINSNITISEDDQILLGHGYESKLSPLPLAFEGRIDQPQMRSARLVRLILRLQDTGDVDIDIGQGFMPLISFHANNTKLDGKTQTFSGDKECRGLGWQRDALKPLWHMRSQKPMALSILSITAEIAINI